MPPAVALFDDSGFDGLFGGVEHVLPGEFTAHDAVWQARDVRGAPAQLGQQRLVVEHRPRLGVLRDTPATAIPFG